MKYKLCILFGGASTEHEVSRRSAESVLMNIDNNKYDIITVGITKDGRWIHYSGGDPHAIRDGSWETHPDNVPCAISPDTSVHGLVYHDGRILRIDVIFPVLHGKNGEDGTVQGLFELAGIPYVGCGVAASANTMDKAITKMFVEREGITQAKCIVVKENEYKINSDDIIQDAVKTLGLPIFVKPARAGSSVGVGKSKTADELKNYIEEALKIDRKIILEEAINGQEIEVAVFGDWSGEVITSPVGEIYPAGEFYTYSAKYDDEGSELFIPARIPESTAVEARGYAERIYRAIECFGLSRADFFLRDDGKVIFNEINAIPGFTSISMYPQLFEASGIPYCELIDRLVMLAFDR